MPSDRNLLIAGAGVTMAIGLTAVLFIWPNYSSAASSLREVQDLQSKMELLEGQVRAIETLESEVQRVQQHIDTSMKLIPEAPDIASVIRKLSQEVDRVTVVDQTFTAGTPCEALAGQGSVPGSSSAKAAAASARSASAASHETAMQAMPLTVDMVASFDSMFALIRNAESLNRLVRVTSVRAALSTAKHDPVPGAPPLLKAAVGLEAIYLPSDGADGAATLSGQKPQLTSAEGS